MTDLVFDLVAPASPHLVFGDDGDGTRIVLFASTIGGPTSTIVVEVPATPVSFAGTLAVPTGSLAAEYSAGVLPYLWGGAGASWRAASALGSTRAYPWVGGARLGGSGAFPWASAARRRPDAVDLPWHAAARLRPGATGAPWRDANDLRPGSTRLPWRDGADMRPGPIDIPWRDGARVAVYRALPWRDGRDVRLERRLPWRDARLAIRAHRLPWRDGALIETHGGWPWPPVVPPEPPVCYEVSPDLVFGDTGLVGVDLVFRCDYSSDGPGATVIVPVRSTYIVINNVSLTLLPGGTEIPCLSLSMALDADSWTWRWSATLPGAALSLVEAGAPVQVSVNGNVFRLVVEGIARDRTFGKSSVRVSGRGRNAELDITAKTFGNPVMRTAAQLMDDALEFTGWAVDFGLEDWLVPAGVWSAQGTPIQAALGVAAAAGGYLQPHRTDQIILARPRYAVAPWEWAGETPDVELPSAVARSESIEWLRKAAYNRVFVSGTRDGILAQVTRAGSAGDVLAPMATEALITEAAAGRQRGLAILGDTGEQQQVAVRLPVLPETGVIEPGKLVRYTDAAATRLGLVRATAVDASGSTLSQTITLEVHE